MADKIDHLISDYVTGRLDVKIKTRRLELSARTSTEDIGGSKTHNNNTAPQELLIMKFDEDWKLRELESKKDILDLWWDIWDQETKDIVNARYVKREEWWKVAQDLYIDERTARRKYQQFKDAVWMGV